MNTLHCARCAGQMAAEHGNARYCTPCRAVIKKEIALAWRAQDKAKRRHWSLRGALEELLAVVEASSPPGSGRQEMLLAEAVLHAREVLAKKGKHRE